MYTHTHTLKQQLAIFQYLSLDLLLGSAHWFPPPPLKCCFPRDREENAAGEEGNTEKRGQSVGICEIIKYSYYHFSPRELETRCVLCSGRDLVSKLSMLTL